MNDNDTRGPLILTAAMETNRVEEVATMTERAELDTARIIAEGRAIAYRRAEHQKAARRTDRLLMGGVGLVVVALWAILFLAFGWKGVAAIVSFALLAGALMLIGGSLWDNRARIGAILSGREPR